MSKVPLLGEDLEDGAGGGDGQRSMEPMLHKIPVGILFSITKLIPYKIIFKEFY